MSSVAYALLWTFVFSLPWESLTATGGVVIITRITGMLAVVGAVGVSVVTGRVRRWHLFHLAALLFVLWAGLGLLVADLEEVPKKYYTYIQLFVVLWIIWELAPSWSRLVGLMVAYILGSYVAALDTIRLYITEGSEMYRFAAGGADPNDLAMQLALALPMAWYLGLTHHRHLGRLICGGFLPFGVMAIGLTGSRGGMLATIVALMIAPLTMARLSASRRTIAVVVLVISGALAVAYVPDTLVERLATTGAEVEDRSLGGRFKLWLAGMQVFMERPFMGWGTSAFKPAVTPILGPRAQVAHNSFISVLVEEGLVGLLLYSLMIITVLLAVLRLPTLERRFALVLLGTLGVAMLPLTWEDRKAVWVILAILLGLGTAGVPHRRVVQPQRRPLSAAPPGRPPELAGPAAGPFRRSPNRDRRT